MTLPARAQAPLAGADEIFASAREPGSPGCVAGVVIAGEFVYKKAHGLADLERGVALTTESALYIASAAKQFTAAMVAHLARENRLSLDDSVRRYVPELPAYADAIRLRHLIHHTSGLRDYPTLQAMAEASGELSEAQFLRLMARQKGLNFVPGEQFLYSNSGYVMLAIVVRRVTGKGLREYSQEVLFRPNQMVGARYQDRRAELIPNRALAYAPLGTGFQFAGDTVDESLPPAESATVGDGWLFMTINDLRGWARYLESAAGAGLFEAGVLTDGTRVDYAFGLVHVSTPQGIRFLAHGGNRGGYRAAIAHYPAYRLTTAVFCNSTALAAQAFEQQLSALFLPPVAKNDSPVVAAAPAAAASVPAAPAPGTSTPVQSLAELTGRYYSDELDARYELSESNGGLRMSGRSLDVQMRPVGKDRFSWSSWTIEFQRGADGRVTGYTLSGTRARGLKFDRL